MDLARTSRVNGSFLNSPLIVFWGLVGEGYDRVFGAVVLDYLVAGESLEDVLERRVRAEDEAVPGAVLDLVQKPAILERAPADSNVKPHLHRHSHVLLGPRE